MAGTFRISRMAISPRYHPLEFVEIPQSLRSVICNKNSLIIHLWISFIVVSITIILREFLRIIPPLVL
jgi:hypothetical protein